MIAAALFSLTCCRCHAPQHKYDKIVTELKVVDPSDDKSVDKLREGFSAFDADDSGLLDKSEIRRLLRAMYPKMSSIESGKAIGKVMETKDKIDFEDFREAVAAWGADQFSGNAHVSTTDLPASQSITTCSV